MRTFPFVFQGQFTAADIERCLVRMGQVLGGKAIPTPIGDVAHGQVPQGRREAVVDETRLVASAETRVQGRDAITRHSFELSAPEGRIDTHFEWFDYAEPWQVRVHTDSPELAVAAHDAVVAEFPASARPEPWPTRDLAIALLDAGAPLLARRFVDQALAVEEPGAPSHTMLDELAMRCRDGVGASGDVAMWE